MSESITLYLHAADPISMAGIASELRGRSDVRLVGSDETDNAEVALVVADEVDDETVRVMKTIQRSGCPRVVLVVTRIDDRSLLSAVEAGCCGLLRRAEATPSALIQAIKAAKNGDGTIPSDLLGRLLQEIGRLQRQVLAPRGLNFAGFTDREIAVLRLVAEGLDTSEIARELSYSERTIKNVIHDVTSRLQLRNRSQAVAYAMREGLI
jgi:DNA-binding NarL/FixJ family response regulator